MMMKKATDRDPDWPNGVLGSLIAMYMYENPCHGRVNSICIDLQLLACESAVMTAFDGFSLSVYPGSRYMRCQTCKIGPLPADNAYHRLHEAFPCRLSYQKSHFVVRLCFKGALCIMCLQ
jgi:hypothetical protein